MQFLLLLLVLLIVGVFLYPPWAEGTDTACAAFGHRARALAEAKHDAGNNPKLQQFFSLVQGTVPAGLLAEAYLRSRFPALPPSLACTAAYWKTWQNPDPTAAVAALKR